MTRDAVAEPTFMLSELEAAIRSSWSAETATPEQREWWSGDNPAFDQCGVTALVVNDLLGGELVCAEVHRDGSRVDYHWWNLLGGGLQVDLTREQFRAGEEIVDPRVLARPPDGELRRLRAEYELLRRRVMARLGVG